MPTGAEQAAVIRGLIAQGQYSEAYSYAADQLSADSSWDPNVVSWLEYAAAINGDQPNFSKDYVFTSNAIAAGLDPDSAEAQLLNQQVSDRLAHEVLSDIASALETGTTISPDDIFREEIQTAVEGFGIPEWAWAG